MAYETRQKGAMIKFAIPLSHVCDDPLLNDEVNRRLVNEGRGWIELTTNLIRLFRSELL